MYSLCHLFFLLCSSQVSNQDSKGVWLHFKFGTSHPAVGKPQRNTKVLVIFRSLKSWSCSLTPIQLSWFFAINDWSKKNPRGSLYLKSTVKRQILPNFLRTPFFACFAVFLCSQSSVCLYCNSLQWHMAFAYNNIFYRIIGSAAYPGFAFLSDNLFEKILEIFFKKSSTHVKTKYFCPLDLFLREGLLLFWSCIF